MKTRALILLAALPLGAQTFSRQVLPARPGPQRLEPDLALLGAARRDLADLRLRDAAGRDVPYLLVPPPAGESWTRARVLPLPATKTASGVELDLGSATASSRLRLEGLPAPFLKRFRLEGSGDRQRWTELVAAGSLFDLPGEGLRRLEADYPEGEYRYLRLTWDDRSSPVPPLPRGAFVRRADRAPAPVRAFVPFERRPAEPGVSRFQVRLPGPRLPLRAVLLTVAGEGPLAREAQVSEPRLRNAGLAPRALGHGGLRRAQALGATASDLRIPLETPEGAELDLRVQDGDNPPLELTQVQVELEPQPWIYFESRDGAPLTALCLGPRAQAPRYDLAGQLERVARSGAHLAAWGPAAAAAAPPAEDLAVGPGAPLDTGGFRVRRSLPAGPKGLTALVLDAHVLAGSPRLRDLRLVDGQGRQVPYLLEARDEPLSLPLAWPKGVAGERITTYRLRLPEAGLPPGKLVLETGARVFRRRVKVLEGRSLEPCAQAEWAHQDPAGPAPALVLELPGQTGADLVVEVQEGDNQPLPIQGARLLLPTWRLRFFRDGGPLLLCYGRDLDAPDYDLALLADRLRDAPAAECLLPATGGTARAGGLEKGFWVVLALAVAGLLALLARLLHKDPQDPVAQ